MSSNYWQSISSRRLSRRTALRGAAALGAGAALTSLMSCGNSTSQGSKSGDETATGLLSKAVDTSASATRGGILPSIITSDAPSFSAYHSIAVYAVQHSDRTYSKFFQ